MSLSDELDDLASKESKPTLKCAFVKALDVKSIDDSDRAKIDELLWERNDGPNRVTNRSITLTLRKSGIPVTFTATDRHRKRECACFYLS